MLLPAAACRCGGDSELYLQTRLDGVVLVKLSSEVMLGLLEDLGIAASLLRNQNVPGMHPADGTIVRFLVLVDFPLVKPRRADDFLSLTGGTLKGDGQNRPD